MNKDSISILFLGTPDFGVPSLRLLVEQGFNIVGVVTSPDKPAGRGLVESKSAVKIAAEELGLRIFQPSKLKDPGFLAEIKALKPDLGVVIAFRMLPELVWRLPRLGTINLHASLLPQYRGAAPINWAIINGEKKTGITTFFLKHEIDTGDLLFAEETPIGPEETAGELYQKLMQNGAQLVLKSVQTIQSGSWPSIPQKQVADLKSAPKIFKETCCINFNQSGKNIHNFVRGLSPFPGAWTKLDGRQLKVFKVDLEPNSTAHQTPGTVLSDGVSYVKVACADGWISLKDIQLEGKKRMHVESFLRGNKIAENIVLG